MQSLQTGIDILLAHPPQWKTQRIALVTNHAATTNTFEPSRTALLKKGFNIIQLFSPEHGLDTTGADGHTMHNTTDPLTGLPVISLYGDQLSPIKKDLAGIDLVLFDIPDIGSRFYTYLWTMTYVLEACATHQLPFIIADRPNPLSGNLQLSEGPMLNETHCSSFIGRWSIPLRHSCTIGELAHYFNSTRNIRGDLQVITCTNWNRNTMHPDHTNSFVPLSPAIPTFESALLYPALCLFEATNLSKGRGTASPFRMAGAPWLNAVATADAFNTTTANTVYARPITFTPTETKYAKQHCHGIMLHVTDPNHFQAVQTGWRLLHVIKKLHPEHFEWAPYPTHVNPTGQRHLDLLLGIPNAAQLQENDLSTDTTHWQQAIQPFLLY